MRLAAFAIAVSLATHAHADPETEMMEAASAFAISNICRDVFGEDDLFEAAYMNLVETFRRHGYGSDEIDEARQELLSQEISEMDDNVFARGFCDLIRDQIM